MATVIVRYKWPAGDYLNVTIDVNATYPDAVNEARVQARRAFTEALAALDTIHLDRGSHNDFDDGHCAVEVVSWLAGEGFTDAPTCASPVLRRYTIALNDRWDDQKRQTLKPYLPRMVGTGDDGKDQLREKIAMRLLLDQLLGPWLRLAGMDTEADQLISLVDASREDQLRALRAVSNAAWELRRTRYDLIRAKVRERLTEKPAADADAVAAADAVAVAAAVAAADDPWGRTYSAAYKAASDYYKQHPLPIAQQVADIAASQQGLALELLEAMIDPAA